MADSGKKPGGLHPSFTPLGIWAFSIGTSIGWGSFIVTCNSYLLKAGILGTVFGLLIGMAVILVITWNLQYMIRQAPNAGGVYTFQKQVGGKDLGFLSLWFILLAYLAVLWANITSLPLFARFFLGDTFQFGFRYTVFGYEVWLGEALLSICAVVLIGLLCSRSSRLPNYIMIVAALIFAVGFTICAVIAMVRHGDNYSYSPLYTDEAPAFAQIVRIAAISPWAFIGFENISHFSEEYRFKVKKIRGILIASVVITTALYLLVSLLSISAYPPEYDSWIAYIRDMGSLRGIKAVPAFYAADHYLGQTGVTVLLLALFGVILTSLIGNMVALSRVMYAAGRDGEAPKFIGKLNACGIPDKAIYVIVAISVLIPFLGRTAIGWIVDVTTLGATIIYGLISHGVYRHAQQAERRREQITGIIGMVLMVIFILLLLIPGLLSFDAMETESYVLFIVWSVLGLAYFRWLIRRDQYREYGQRIIVWIILLILMLFASMMWVSRATETAANNAVERIYKYHQSHPEIDSKEEGEKLRVQFLEEQAKHISSTNTLYTIVSLGLFVISTSIMLNNYRDTRKLSKQLSLAEKSAATDPLTGVKNRYSYLQYSERMDAEIEAGTIGEFAVVVCDVNDLKVANDTLGHNAGDKCIRRACERICKTFTHSPVFRIGGDEFAVLLTGQDYEEREQLIELLQKEAREDQHHPGASFAVGISEYQQREDDSVLDAFTRADHLMYQQKRDLKESREKRLQQEGEKA